MAADFLPAARAGLTHRLLLPPRTPRAASPLEEAVHALGGHSCSGPVVLHAHDWLLTVADLRALGGQLSSRGLTLSGVEGGQTATLVAASALGLTTLLQRPDSHPLSDTSDVPADLLIHRGTLRSGDHLEVNGSALLLGDVNPGGRVSAAGHVLVWGRLRGVAHAGYQGDRSAKIVALQLRPLQLRIADVVARGPEEPPPDGCCEQARLIDGVIRIDPAEPIWPLEC